MNNKTRLLSFLLALTLTLFACLACACGSQGVYTDVIEEEMRACFDFFYNEANTNVNSPAYGIIADRWPTNSKLYGSIASVGFGLTALVIGVQKEYITHEEGQTRALGTLRTLLALQDNPQSAYEGFFYHFLSMSTGEKYGDCEVSTIDTAIMLCGALTCAAFFGDEVEQAAYELYGNVNWRAFIVNKNGKSYISMAYSDGKVSRGCWDYYAEQLMIYVLGAGSPTQQYRLDDTQYYDFTRNVGIYAGNSYIYSFFGSLFTYQYSHAWIDFSQLKDKEGVNWYDNSVAASKAAYAYSKTHNSLTLSAKSWGLTACDTPAGYNGYLGTPPRGWSPSSEYLDVEGTVAPSAALGSVVFTPKQSLAALKYFYSLESFTCKYGLLDSYNADKNWKAMDVIGIDKGITLLMLANHCDQSVWKLFMQDEYILNGLEVLGFEQDT